MIMAARLHRCDSQRIAWPDEICFALYRICFRARIYGCTGDTVTYTAPESLSGRVAELRRRDRYAAPDFFRQQRFWAWEDRRKDGRILPESAHLIQARPRHAENRRSRSMDARSGPGDLHHLHHPGRRPETGWRCARQPRRTGKIEMAALHVATGIRCRAFSFC